MTDTRCSVYGCKRRKAEWHLCCAVHWAQVPPEQQQEIYDLYKTVPGSPRHREVCFRIMADLNRDERRRQAAARLQQTSDALKYEDRS